MALMVMFSEDHRSVFVRDSSEKSFVRIDGNSCFATDHNKSDPMHQFLDTLDPATVSKMFDGSVVFLNPNNPRTTPSIKAVAKVLNEN